MYGQQVLLSVARDGTNISKSPFAAPGTNFSRGTPTAGAAIRCGNLARIASDQNWRRPGAQRAILTSFSFFIAPTTTTTPVVFAAPRCDAGETGARTGRDAIGARAEHVGAAAYRADIRCAVLRGEK